MTVLRVAAEQRLDGVDPARVWAFVADPKNLATWAPARSTGYLGTELPSAGQTLFLHRARRTNPERAWRCRIEAWDAGHHVRCALETPGAAHDQAVELTVRNDGSGAQPIAVIAIVYRGEVPRIGAWLYRWRVTAMVRRSIRNIHVAVIAG